VLYKLSPFTWFFAKRIATVKHVSMTNLIAGRELFPELLQDQATPELVAANLHSLLTDEERQDEIFAGMAGVQNAMGTPGAAGRAADLIIQKLE
jgi:lipid-A-disaccharide synthase